MPSRTLPQILLQSADGHVFEVGPHIYKRFELVKLMIEDPSETLQEAVPVPDVNAVSLRKVLIWAEYHMDDPLEHNGMHICEWDRVLLQVEHDMLIQVVQAAHYLGIPGLLDVASNLYSDLIREELRLRNDENDDFVTGHFSMSLGNNSASDNEDK
nr:S-phase kinase-associated protein 1-like [Aedes albopictus]